MAPVLNLEAGLRLAATGNTAPRLTTADLNNDGITDIACVAVQGAGGAVLLGRVEGGLEPRRNFETAPLPIDVAAADLNGDGNQDLVTPLYKSNGIGVVLGRGDGSFGEPASYSAGQEPAHVIAADLNGDSALDIAAVSFTKGDVIVLPGKGDGTLGPKAIIYHGEYPSGLAALDADGDGKMDLAVSWEDIPDSVVLLQGNGDGTFAKGWKRTLSSMGPIASFDANGDGYPDLVVAATDSSKVHFLFGKGDGTFPTLKFVDLGLGVRATSLLPWDFDRDGDIDVAVSYYFYESITVLLNDGTGTFTKGDEFQASYWSTDLAAADIDRDGKGDLLAAVANDIVVFQGNGDATFRTAAILPSADEPEEIAISDLDDDGNLDIIVGSYGETSISVSFGTGDGAFAPRISLEAGRSPLSLTAVDLDLDGLDDLAVTAREDNAVALFLNRGLRSFRKAASLSTGQMPSSIVGGDLDGDGLPDLATGDYQPDNLHYLSFLSIFPGNGDGSFRERDPIPLPSSGPKHVEALDADRNGFLDLLVSIWGQEGHPGDSLALFLNRGDGTFRYPRPFAAGGPSGHFATADLDSDGNLDLLDVVYTGISILCGNGDGTFGAPTLYPVYDTIQYNTAKFVSIADLDGDFILDVAYTFAIFKAACGLGVRTGTGDGTLGAERYFDVGADPFHIAAGDFDGNGRIDLVTSNFSSNGLSLVFNRSGPRSSPDCNRSGVPDSCDIRDGTSRDVDGNGVPDECQPDCNGNGIPDTYEIATQPAALDCDGDGIIDRCAIASGMVHDCGGNGVPDSCDIWDGTSRDVDRNGVPDECQPDCNGNGIPDTYEIATQPAALDCDGDGIIDRCAITSGMVHDCDGNGVPDSCDIRSGASRDCNENGVPDHCDIAADEQDRNGNGIPDDCEIWSCRVPGDVNGDGILNIVDPICFLRVFFFGMKPGLPYGDGSAGDPCNLLLLDWQRDGRLDISDGIGMLLFLFLGGPPHPLAFPGRERIACVAFFGCADGGPGGGEVLEE